MAKELTLSVPLNLEESGMLCHCLMRAFMDSTYLKHPNVSSALDLNTDAFAKRMRNLYSKLADANDELMGRQ